MPAPGDWVRVGWTAAVLLLILVFAGLHVRFSALVHSRAAPVVLQPRIVYTSNQTNGSACAEPEQRLGDVWRLQIAADMAPFNTTGISRAMVDAAAAKQRGLSRLLIYRNRIYFRPGQSDNSTDPNGFPHAHLMLLVKVCLWLRWAGPRGGLCMTVSAQQASLG